MANAQNQNDNGPLTKMSAVWIDYFSMAKNHEYTQCSCLFLLVSGSGPRMSLLMISKLKLYHFLVMYCEISTLAT